jgi:hypothetical protein
LGAEDLKPDLQLLQGYGHRRRWQKRLSLITTGKVKVVLLL